MKLAEALGWKTEAIVRTAEVREKFDTPLPNHYKLDVADPERKIAVEIDGGSHTTLLAQERDARKQLALELLGWIVLRFSNRDVTERLEECVQMRNHWFTTGLALVIWGIIVIMNIVALVFAGTGVA
ncbi:DUF559 domain-containing protein [bacterium]|nr:MAG: DUF559 domain-containing protein [bacterium]